MSSTSISISELLRETEHIFSEATIPTPRLDAEVLLAYALGVTRPYLHAHATDLLQGPTLMQFNKLVGRRLHREPVAYITGKKEFYSREFAVTSNVLIPRPETEEVVELALSQLEGRRVKEEGRESQQLSELSLTHDTTTSQDMNGGEPNSTEEAVAHRASRTPQGNFPEKIVPCENSACREYSEGELGEAAVKETQKILDVGCGSGCVGITLKLERPELDITLCDISPKAIEVARENAEKLGADVHFTESDLLSSFTLHPSSFSAIIANLPYVDKAWETSPETAYEPSLALYAKDNGLALIKKLIEQSSDVLDKHGLLLLEADPEQHEAIIAFAANHGFKHQETLGYALSLTKLSQV